MTDKSTLGSGRLPTKTTAATAGTTGTTATAATTATTVADTTNLIAYPAFHNQDSTSEYGSVQRSKPLNPATGRRWSADKIGMTDQEHEIFLSGEGTTQERKRYQVRRESLSSSVYDSFNDYGKSPVFSYKSNDSAKAARRKNQTYLHPYLAMMDDYFCITERGSTIGTELKAGLVTFLTMSYIVLVNPRVLHVSGVPLHYAATSTCLSSCIATLIAGLFSNLPVGCAPGVGLSAYFSYGMMSSLRSHVSNSTGEEYKIGFTIVFISGVIVLVLALTGLISFFINRLPNFLKLSTVVGMGLSLTFIGLLRAGIVVPNTSGGDNVLELGPVSHWQVWLAIGSILLTGVLEMHRVNGALLVGIVIVTVTYFALTNVWPSAFVDTPSFANPLTILNFNIPLRDLLTAGISFVLVLILDVSGILFGVGKMTGLLVKKNGKMVVEGGQAVLVAVSTGTIIAALTGGSPVIVQAESVAGIAAGGRTGLTALTVSFFFALSIFFGPTFSSIPDLATAPSLVLVGIFMMKQVQQIEWTDENGHIVMTIAMPSFLTIIMMPFTYSIANGIFFGIGSFIVLTLCTGKWLDYCRWWRRARSASAKALARDSLQKNDSAGIQALIHDNIPFIDDKLEDERPKKLSIEKEPLISVPEPDTKVINSSKDDNIRKKKTLKI